MPRKTSTPDAPAPAPATPVNPPIASDVFALALLGEPAARVMNLLAARFAAAGKRGAARPAELEGIAPAALKAIADALDLYADQLPPPPQVDHSPNDPPPNRAGLEPTTTGNAAAYIGGQVDTYEPSSDPDMRAEQEREPWPATFVAPISQPHPAAEPSPEGDMDEPVVMTPAEPALVGAPFSRGRVRPSADYSALLNPGPLSWPDHDSISSIQTYAGCGWRYLAEYGHGLKNAGPPAWWNIGGTAAHAVIEGWERVRADGRGSPSPDDVAKVFTDTLAEHVETVRAQTEIPPEDWRTANQGREGREFWEDNGPGWVAAYVKAQEGRTFEPVMMGDVLGLELAGVVRVGPQERPFEVRIDAIFGNVTTGELRVRDYKYGRPPAPGGLQLPAYRYAAAHLASGTFNVATDPGLPGGGWTGEYWLGRKAVATEPIPLPYELGLHRVVAAVNTLEAARAAHVFMPNPTSMCSACPLKPICPAFTADGKSVIDNG